MIQNVLITISLLASILGFVRPVDVWDDTPLNFGATNYPGALDSLINPSATDSVATVSHSAQHANANDAIEALQAKLGISASTAISNSILAGNGTGSSIWTTFATTTSLATTNLLATGSSTLQAFTFTTATGTSATTTNLFATTASTTNFFGGGLSSCTGINFLQWTAGRFGCAEGGGSGATFFSTTTAQNLATTTISSTELPTGDTLEIVFSVPNIVGAGATTTANLVMSFNDDLNNANYVTSRIIGASHGTLAAFNGVLIYGAGSDGRFQRFASVKLANLSGHPKTGAVSSLGYGTSTPITSTGNYDGTYFWVNTDKVTNIKFWWDVPQVFFGTTTAVRITGY